MQRNLLSSLLFTVVIVGAVSCGRSDKTAFAVPKDAGLVIHINASSLTSKLTWQEIKASDWFKKAYEEASDSVAKALLDNPENSGIDTKGDLVFFMKKQGKGGYGAFTGSVKDAAVFEAFNKKITDGAALTKSGDFSIMKIKGSSVLVFNSKRFAYIGDVPMPNIGNQLFGRGGSYQEPFKFPADSLQQFGTQLLTLSGDDNLGTDDRFADLIKEAGDVHMWFNTGQYLSNMGGEMLSMLKLNAILEGNVSATTFNFDNGKMTMKSKQYYSKEMMNLMDKYPAGNVSEDLVNRIPSDNVVAVFAMKYPPAGLKEFLKLIGVDGMVNGYLGRLDYSIDEFVKANKGDLLVSVSDVTMTKGPDRTIQNPGGEPFVIPGRTEPDAKILFATSINDKPAFDKLVGAVQKTIGEAGAEAMAEKVHYKLDNNWFAASNSPDFVNAFLANGGKKQSFASRISGHAFGAYVDIQKVIKIVGEETTDSTGKAMQQLSLAMWQDVVMVSGGQQGGAVTSEIEVNLVDKNTNSLKQLNRYFDNMSKLQPARPRYTPDVMVDSTTMTPPAPPSEKN